MFHTVIIHLLPLVYLILDQREQSLLCVSRCRDSKDFDLEYRVSLNNVKTHGNIIWMSFVLCLSVVCLGPSQQQVG